MLERAPVAPSGGVWGVQSLLLAVADSLATRFGALTVRGEIGSFTRASSGHCYFTLKDAAGAGALLRCAMFRRAANLLDFDPRESQQVEVLGRVAVYEPRGELQFVAEAMRRVGAGTLYEEFLRLKAKLEGEGLFDVARKRPITAEPRCVGVVTSPGAAAWHDVVAALRRRAPHVAVVLYPSLVQGAEAPAALVAAMATANRRAEAQTLLLVRGGGSLEDLWAFNDERVVRAVAASALPVVCGVGHETDVSLCDLAADLRAPTPTAAAELAAPARDELGSVLQAQRARLQRATERVLQAQAQRADRLAFRLAAPTALLGREQQRLAAHGPRLQRAMQQALHSRRDRLLRWQQGLEALNPLRVLERGYALVEDASGAPLRSARQVRVAQRIAAVWADGRAMATVDEVNERGAQPHARRG